MISGGGGDVGMASELVDMGDSSFEIESRLWRIFLSEGMLVSCEGDAMRCDAMDVDKGGDLYWKLREKGMEINKGGAGESGNERRTEESGGEEIEGLPEVCKAESASNRNIRGCACG